MTGGSRASGGSINEAWALELAGGGRAFVKTRADAAPGEYATEAAGLRWLAQAEAVALPGVLAVGEDDGPRFLALEWVDEGRLDARGRGGARARAGRAARAPGARLRRAAARRGRPPDARPPRRCASASSRCPTTPLADWPSFYASAAWSRWWRCAWRAAR